MYILLYYPHALHPKGIVFYEHASLL